MPRIVPFLLLALMTASCVSAQKYRTLESQNQANEQELKKSKDQIVEMTAMINDLQSRLGTSSQDKTKLQTSVTEMRQALADLQKRKVETEKRVQEFTDLTKRFQKMIDTGKLSVQIVDGRMVVVLGSDILFASGSERLSPAGSEAIRETAKVLITIPDRKFQIEGHTDNAPIKTAKFPSNWELASGRAVSVVNEMLSEGMPKERISAASFADGRPVASNKSASGKQANRRIEIVVVPDLSSLPGFDELRKISEQKQN